MDTSKFLTHEDEFPVLDLVARLEFKSHSSISFGLSRKMWGKGWIDVHHPCDGLIKAQIRVQINDDYLTLDKMKAVIESIFDALRIPSDETYEAEFFRASAIVQIGQPLSRDGYIAWLDSK